MKGFVGDVWKIAAAFASGAFLLSLVTGLIAGNPFGVVIFRAFLLAVLFAGLGAGLRFAIKTYLPELLGSSGSAAAGGSGSADAAAEGAGNRGAAVDIVLQDDEGLRRQAYGGPGGGRPGDAATDEEGEESLAASLDGDFMSQGDTGGLPELTEELAEELPPAGESAGVGAPAAEPGEDPAEEMEPSDELPRGMRGAAGGTDSLPDIDGLEAPEEKPARPPAQNPRSTAARPLRSADVEKPGDAVRDALSGQDPSTLARAIRTVLKNAEKG